MPPASFKRAFIPTVLLCMPFGFVCVFAVVLTVPWDPGVYVGWNDIIVEGELIRLWETGPREMPEYDGYHFRGQAGLVLIESVIYNKTDRVLSCGDTLSFFLRTAETSEPKGDTSCSVYDTFKPIDLPIGTTGYFALDEGQYRIRPSNAFFYIDEGRAKEVVAFLACLAADSAATVNALERRHPGLRGFKFRPVGH